MTDKNTVEKENFQLFETLFRLLNYMGNDRVLTQMFTDWLPREHRTLQQNFMRMLQTIVYAYADQSQNNFDLRNEAAVDWAKAVGMLRQLPHVNTDEEAIRFVNELRAAIKNGTEGMPFI
jgi:hypothetical protein